MIDFQLLMHSFPSLLHGAAITLLIAAGSCLLGLTCGIVLGVGQATGNFLVRAAIFIYVAVIRGTPMLIHIFVAFYVLPQLGISIPPLWAAIVAIGLNSAAYISQIVRSGINSVGKGQQEAARVLGFTQGQTTRYIVLPQALRSIIPSLGNEFVTLVKDSSLASAIGVMELTYEGNIIKSKTFDPVTIYCGVALIYLSITTLLSVMTLYLEKRMQVHARA